MARRVLARGREAMCACEETAAVGQRLYCCEGWLRDDCFAFLDIRHRDESGFPVIRVAHASYGRPPATESRLERNVVVIVGGGGCT
jgi:hypothetical protein